MTALTEKKKILFQVKSDLQQSKYNIKEVQQNSNL